MKAEKNKGGGMSALHAYKDYASIGEALHLSHRPAPVVSSNQIQILLVEDCVSDVYLVEKMLHDASPEDEFAIVDVPRLTDAFKILDSAVFDLIMLDLNLLDIDGIASVAALKAEVPNIPLIVYTGSDDPKMREEALMCGAEHYLVKGKESPYSLRFVLKRAIGNR